MALGQRPRRPPHRRTGRSGTGDASQTRGPGWGSDLDHLVRGTIGPSSAHHRKKGVGRDRGGDTGRKGLRLPRESRRDQACLERASLGLRCHVEGIRVAGSADHHRLVWKHSVCRANHEISARQELRHHYVVQAGPLDGPPRRHSRYEAPARTGPVRPLPSYSAGPRGRKRRFRGRRGLNLVGSSEQANARDRVRSAPHPRPRAAAASTSPPTKCLR